MSDGHASCPGCPHPNYTHSHQRWAIPGPKDRGRAQPDPWDTENFRKHYAHLTRKHRALLWVWKVYGQRHPNPLEAP